MTEYSWPWSTVAGLGDGTAELNEAWSRRFLAQYFLVQDEADEGVSKGVGNELLASGVVTPIEVLGGSAICHGLYISNAQVDLDVVTPAVGTTGGRVVLQTNWAGTGGALLEARTRLAIVMSADGVPGIPALTQVYGTTWEISIATFTITTGGAITLTDDRTFRRSTAMVDTDEIIDLAVETAKINNQAVTEQKIGALAVTSGKIGAGAVIAGKLGAGAVNSSDRMAVDVVDDARLRDSAALSVIGRSVNSSGDPADIAEKILLLKNRPEVRSRLIERGKLRISTFFPRKMIET
jgi:hypothetical protein